MIAQPRRKSAQIIQFPPPEARVRWGAGHKAETKQGLQIFKAETAEFGGAWYHEAAILEADRARKP